MFADFPRFVVLVWFLDHFWRISAHLPDCAMQLKQTEAGTSLYLGRILKLFIQNLNENVKSSYIRGRPQKYDKIFHFCNFQNKCGDFVMFLWPSQNSLKNRELGIATRVLSQKLRNLQISQ